MEVGEAKLHKNLLPLLHFLMYCLIYEVQLLISVQDLI